MPKLRRVSAACLLTLSALCGQAWAQAQRIVSLLPSATEAVCALGACDRLVGVDDFSHDLSELSALPRLGKTWQPHVEAIVQLKPDLVLVGRSPAVQDKLQALGLHVQEVDALTIDDAYAVLRRLDPLLGTQQASTVIADIEQQLTDLRQQAAHLRPQRVYIEVDAALYSAGSTSFMGQLLAQLGAINIAQGLDAPYPRLSPEYVVQRAPELIIQTYAQGAQALHARPGWQHLPAMQQGRICPLTPQERRIATRPGPRMAQAAAIFLRCLRMPLNAPTE